MTTEKVTSLEFEPDFVDSPEFAQKFRPLSDRVVIEAVEPAFDQLTKGGIYLPQTIKKNEPREGKAIAVGPGRTLDNGEPGGMEVAVGDTVVFANFAGTEAKAEGKSYLIVSERDILVIKEDIGLTEIQSIQAG